MAGWESEMVKDGPHPTKTLISLSVSHLSLFTIVVLSAETKEIYKEILEENFGA